MAHPGGRPTDYSQEKLEAAKEYVKYCTLEKEIPFVEELAIKLDVHRDSLYEWSKVHPEFSDTLKSIENLQRYMLQRHSLDGKYNTTAAIFQLKVNHGFIEASEIRHTGKDGKDLPQPILTGAFDVRSDNGSTQA